jgi:hypothetical protein
VPPTPGGTAVAGETFLGLKARRRRRRKPKSWASTVEDIGRYEALRMKHNSLAEWHVRECDGG